MVNTPGGITGSLAALNLMMNESAIAAMNRNEVSKASSASSKSLFVIAVLLSRLVGRFKIFGCLVIGYIMRSRTSEMN